MGASLTNLFTSNFNLSWDSHVLHRLGRDARPVLINPPTRIQTDELFQGMRNGRTVYFGGDYDPNTRRFRPYGDNRGGLPLSILIQMYNAYHHTNVDWRTGVLIRGIWGVNSTFATPTGGGVSSGAGLRLPEEFTDGQFYTFDQLQAAKVQDAIQASNQGRVSPTFQQAIINAVMGDPGQIEAMFRECFLFPTSSPWSHNITAFKLK